MRLLIVEPQYGLGNRMRAIDSAVVLAREIDARLRVVWTFDRHLAAPFGSLFEPPPEIAELVELDLRGDGRDKPRARRYVESCKPELFLDSVKTRSLATGRLDPRGLGADGTLYIRTWERFRSGAAPCGFFVPIAPLRDAIDGTVSRFHQTIGVHVRRGDNNWSIATSATELFIDAMRRALDRAEARSFFLATDDPGEQRRLEAEFPGAILSYPKRSLDRREAVSAEDAVVDLFCLARTRRLLGSHWSSFSRTAAQMGGIPLHIVGLERRSWGAGLLDRLRSLWRA